MKHISTIFTLGLLFASTYGNGAWQVFVGLDPLVQHVAMLEQRLCDTQQALAHQRQRHVAELRGKDLQYRALNQEMTALRAMGSEVVTLRRENAELRARVARVDVVNFETVQKELEDLKKLYANADNVTEVVALRTQIRTLTAQVAALQSFANANKALTAKLDQANKEIAGLREERAKKLVAQPAMAQPAALEGPDFWNKLLGL